MGSGALRGWLKSYLMPKGSKSSLQPYKNFRNSINYQDKLTDYGTIVYVECIDDMIKLVTKIEVKTAISTLPKVNFSYEALVSSIQTIQVELPKADLATGKVQEVGSQWPLEENGGSQLVLDPNTFDDILGEDPL